MMRRGRRSALALLLLGSCFASRALDRDVVDVNRLKAAFVFNFTQFIEWPEQSFASAETPFLICLPGPASGLSAALAPLEKRSYKGRAIAIQRPTTVAEARKCQILYLSDTRTALADGKPLLAQLGGSPTLTVSEMQDTAASGAGIGFVEQEGRLRLVIDLGLLRPSKLRPSAKLLEIALAVNGG